MRWLQHDKRLHQKDHPLMAEGALVKIVVSYLLDIDVFLHVYEYRKTIAFVNLEDSGP